MATISNLSLVLVNADDSENSKGSSIVQDFFTREDFYELHSHITRYLRLTDVQRYGLSCKNICILTSKDVRLVRCQMFSSPQLTAIFQKQLVSAQENIVQDDLLRIFNRIAYFQFLSINNFYTTGNYESKLMSERICIISTPILKKITTYSLERFFSLKSAEKKLSTKNMQSKPSVVPFKEESKSPQTLQKELLEAKRLYLTFSLLRHCHQLKMDLFLDEDQGYFDVKDGAFLEESIRKLMPLMAFYKKNGIKISEVSDVNELQIIRCFFELKVWLIESTIEEVYYQLRDCPKSMYPKFIKEEYPFADYGNIFSNTAVSLDKPIEDLEARVSRMLPHLDDLEDYLSDLFILLNRDVVPSEYTWFLRSSLTFIKLKCLSTYVNSNLNRKELVQSINSIYKRVSFWPIENKTDLHFLLTVEIYCSIGTIMFSREEIAWFNEANKEISWFNHVEGNVEENLDTFFHSIMGLLSTRLLSLKDACKEGKFLKYERSLKYIYTVAQQMRYQQLIRGNSEQGLTVMGSYTWPSRKILAEMLRLIINYSQVDQYERAKVLCDQIIIGFSENPIWKSLRSLTVCDLYKEKLLSEVQDSIDKFKGVLNEKLQEKALKFKTQEGRQQEIKLILALYKWKNCRTDKDARLDWDIMNLEGSLEGLKIIKSMVKKFKE